MGRAEFSPYGGAGRLRGRGNTARGELELALDQTFIRPCDPETSCLRLPGTGLFVPVGARDQLSDGIGRVTPAGDQRVDGVRSAPKRLGRPMEEHHRVRECVGTARVEQEDPGAVRNGKRRLYQLAHPSSGTAFGPSTAAANVPGAMPMLSAVLR